MSKETENKAKEVKGKYSWAVPAFEFVMVIGYFALGWSAVMDMFTTFNFLEFFRNIEGAIYFLIGCTIISTIMCFIPAFKSKNNMYIAVSNIVWLGFNLYGFLG